MLRAVPRVGLAEGASGVARILVIDDEELVRQTLRLGLESAGHEVAEARNGEDGLLALEKSPADLVITDIIMPEKEGIEMIVELRRRHPRTAILAISGGSRTGNIDFLRMARKLGATASLSKPFTNRQLLEAVDSCLHGPPDRS